MKTPNNLTRVIASLALPALSLLAVSTPAQAQEAAPAVPAQDLRQIEEAARAEIRRQAPEATVEITPMDPRLRLPNCDRPLQASLPPNINLGARATVRVSCGGGTVSWMATVPVSLFTEVPVVVLRRALPMGSIVGAEDVTVAARRFPGTVNAALRHLSRSSAAWCAGVCPQIRFYRWMPLKRPRPFAAARRSPCWPRSPGCRSGRAAWRWPMPGPVRPSGSVTQRPLKFSRPAPIHRVWLE